MKNNYLEKITELLKQARPKLSTTHRLEFKNVFGAVGGYVDGKIFTSCGKFGVALRLPPNRETVPGTDCQVPIVSSTDCHALEKDGKIK